MGTLIIFADKTYDIRILHPSNNHRVWRSPKDDLKRELVQNSSLINYYVCQRRRRLLNCEQSDEHRPLRKVQVWCLMHKCPAFNYWLVCIALTDVLCHNALHSSYLCVHVWAKAKRFESRKSIYRTTDFLVHAKLVPDYPPCENFRIYESNSLLPPSLWLVKTPAYASYYMLISIH